MILGMINKPEAQAIDKDAVIDIIKETTEPEFSAISDKLSSIHVMVEEVAKIAEGVKVRELVVKVPEKQEINVGLVHFKFDQVFLAAMARVNIMLVGEAGSGKTTTCEQVAQGMSLPFYMDSFCSQSSKTDLLGYRSITDGAYISTGFRKAYEEGGVYLADEMDNGNPNILSVFNTALANGYCSFPDKVVKRHPDFVMIAAANTYGTGANRTYIGRNQLDAATLDRFVNIDFPYDEALELQIAGNEKWTRFVQSVREELKNERVVISPRASINGAKLLAIGWNIEDVIDSVLKSGLTPDLKLRVDLRAKKY